MAVTEINSDNPKKTTRLLREALLKSWVEDARWFRLTGLAGVYNPQIAKRIAKYADQYLKEHKTLPAGPHRVPVKPAGELDRHKAVEFLDADKADYRLSALERIKLYRRKRLRTGTACFEDVIAFLHAGFLGANGRLNAIVEPMAWHLLEWIESPSTRPLLEVELWTTGRVFNLDMSRNPEARWISQEGAAFAQLVDHYPGQVSRQMVASRLRGMDKHLARWESQPPAALPSWAFRQYLLMEPGGHQVMLVMVDFEEGLRLFQIAKSDEAFLANLSARKMLRV